MRVQPCSADYLITFSSPESALYFQFPVSGTPPQPCAQNLQSFILSALGILRLSSEY